MFVHACRGVFGSMIQQKMCVKVCKKNAFVYLFFIPVWGCMCARWCILRKHTSECMLVPSGTGHVYSVRTVDWGLAWLPGMLAKLWLKLAHGHVVTLHVAYKHRETHCKSQNTVKERKKEKRACEEDTKEAFIHSGFEFAFNGADAAVDLNSNLIAQERVSLVLKPHSACFTTEYVKALHLYYGSAIEFSPCQLFQ